MHNTEEMAQELANHLTLAEVRENPDYINRLNKTITQLKQSHSNVTLRLLMDEVHNICPELKEFCQENEEKFKVTSVKDKGVVGKIVEFYLFGNLPNCNSCSDTPYGDIKATHFKSCCGGSNAKERLTITNFGDPNKEDNISLISDKNSIKETKFYKKMQTGIIFAFQHDKTKYDTIESIYNKKLLAVILYNLDDIFEKHTDVANTFQEDFDKIKKCIVEKAVTQKGQKYLHIHPHGSKNSKTRAFGFTNKFLTKLVSIQLNLTVNKKGKSEYIAF
jgi:hypothetical protein